MNNQDAKGLIKMPVAKYSRTGLPSGCRIIIILSKLTNPKEKKNQEKHKGLNKTKPTYRITSSPPRRTSRRCLARCPGCRCKSSCPRSSVRTSSDRGARVPGSSPMSPTPARAWS